VRDRHHGTEREERETPTGAEPVRPSAPPLDVANILQLQRAYGNRSVAAALLARQPVEAPALPPIADNLKRFRDGCPRLKALAARKPPVVPTAGFVDIQPALDWLRELVDTLTIVEPIVDPSMLLFESLVVTGHDEEYSRAGSEIGPQLAAALKAVIPIARDIGDTIARVVMEQVNRSSVGIDARDADPQLAALENVTTWREKSSALHALAAKVDPGGAGLTEVAHSCEGAALALLQARAVLNARATWRADAAQSSTPAQIGSGNRPRNEVDDIFADSGFGSRQSLRQNGTRDDWCGMFVAASMFRGAALDKNARMAFAHTDNVYDFFRYSSRPVNDKRTPLSIWAEGQWWGVKAYHEQRGLPRKWVQGAALDGADIRPGDVALIRHKGTKPAGEVANHIVMVDSWDPTTGKLVTMEGNVLEGVRPDGAGEAKRTPDGDLASTKTTAPSPSSTAAHVRDMNDQQTKTPGRRPGRGLPGAGRPDRLRHRPPVAGRLRAPRLRPAGDPRRSHVRLTRGDARPREPAQAPRADEHHRVAADRAVSPARRGLTWPHRRATAGGSRRSGTRCVGRTASGGCVAGWRWSRSQAQNALVGVAFVLAMTALAFMLAARLRRALQLTGLSLAFSVAWLAWVLMSPAIG
jgi:hypothetical protein